MSETPIPQIAPPPRILAIVLNWNGAAMTRACCAGLAEQTRPGLHVRVVDNGSTCDTVETLRAACPGAEVVATGRNLGFAGGVNAGLRAGGGFATFDYVWLVNNDAVCDPDALARLLAAAEADASLAAVGCAMREDDGRGGERRVAAGKRLRPSCHIPREPRVGESPDYLCGACLLVRREALEDVGLLDEAFFFFFEDADWSFRATAKGWRLGVAEGAPIRHLGGGSIRRQSRNRSRFYRAGHVRFVRRHARHPLLAALPPFAYRLAAELIRFELAAARGTLEGFRDGLRS